MNLRAILSAVEARITRVGETVRKTVAWHLPPWNQRLRAHRRLIPLIATLLLIATMVDSSIVPGPWSATGPGGSSPGATNSSSLVNVAPGVAIVQSGSTSGSSSSAGAVALSTKGGKLGGIATGNVTQRVDPAPASFPSQPTEIVTLRSAHSRYVANPNGTISETVSSARLNFQDSTGAWKPIDTALVGSTATSGYNLSETSNNGGIVFNTSSASSPIAALVGPGFKLSFRVADLTGKVSRSGADGLAFATSSGHSSIVTAANSDGFEFGAVLSASSAPNSYSFAVGTDGLTLALAPNGSSVEVLQGQSPNQKLLGLISAPTLLDAHGAAAPSSSVKVALDSSAAGLRSGETMLTYTIDPSWLAGSGRAYPVTLDPTACIRWDATTTCNINQAGKNGNGYVDTFINSANPNAVGTGSIDHVGVDPTLGVTRSLYYFPEAALPDGAQIVSASLGVYVAGGTQNGQVIQASGITAGWDSAVTNWNNQPSVDLTTAVTAPIGGVSGGWLNIDVSNIERARYTLNNADWAPDLGLELRTVDETNPCNSGSCGGLRFNDSGMGSNEPTLTLTYVTPHVKIDFDPTLGPDYAPSKMPVGSTMTLPVTVDNAGSGYTFNHCGGGTGNCYMVGYRWYDSTGANVNIAGFTSSGMVDLPIDLQNVSWSNTVNLSVSTPPNAGQYHLRIDLVHVVNGQFIWASDWANPSLYFARAKDDLNSTNVHVVGQSVIGRNDFTIAVTSGATAGGYPKSVKLPDGSTASIDLSSGNLTVSASSGLGFADLGGPISLSYYYDSAQTTQAAACYLILKACGWGTNFDEQIENASSGSNLTYRDEAGNRYFISPNANGQLISNAPDQIDRPRITVLDENVVAGWTTTGSGLPTITTSDAISGTHSYSFNSANTAGATTSGSAVAPINVNLNQYQMAGFEVKSSGGGMGVGFQIQDKTTGLKKWLVYTYGTDFSLPDPNAVKIAEGGNPSGWVSAGGSSTQTELNLLSAVLAYRNGSGVDTFGGPNDQYSVVGIGMYGNGSAGADLIDALRFEPGQTVFFDDPTASSPTWTSGGSNATISTQSPAVGTSYLQVSPAGLSSEPTVKGLNIGLSSSPYVNWYWRKVGGSTVSQTFYVHDAKSNTTGTVTYYAGPTVPAGVDATTAIQVSATAPNAWTRVTKDIQDDARQLNKFYNNQSTSYGNATPGTPAASDPVVLDGYTLDAVDGSYAGFDAEALLSQPSVNATTGQMSASDFVVTLTGGETHAFNQDGLLTSIRDLDGNPLTLKWNYDYTTTTGGPTAYQLSQIIAPSAGMPTGASGTGPAAIREIDVTYTSTSVKFTEKLGVSGATSGRSAEFDTNSAGDLVTVNPASNAGACATSGPRGCVGYAYDSSHDLTRVYDPRYDGSNSDYTDVGYSKIGFGAGSSTATTITPAATGDPLLRVLAANANPSGAYQRPEWQTADSIQANYAYYADLTSGGSAYTEFRAIPCAAANCAGGTTTPAIPTDMLVAYRTDGLGSPTQETRYRLPGNLDPVITRRGTLAVAKIDNYPDALQGAQVTWSQSADQYVASVQTGNGDLYKTTVTYNSLGRQTSSTTAATNPAFGDSAPWSKQSVNRTVEQIYDTKGHLVQSDDNTYLANTDFENGSTGWTLSAGASIDNSSSFSGVASLSLSGAAVAQQQAQLVPGQTFRFQADLRNDGGAPAVGIRYQKTSGTWAALPVSVPTVGSSWTQLANDVTIPLDGTGLVEVDFSVAGSSGAAHVDDIALMTSFSASAYDSRGLLTSTTDISGRVTKYGYAPYSGSLPAGMPTPGATPSVFATSTTANYIDGNFDPSHPDQDVTSHLAYDTWGNAVLTVDADGVANWTLYAANEIDITSTADGAGDATSYTYDQVGNKLTVTPPNGTGERRTVTYDLLNDPVDVLSPNGSHTHFVYDGAGQAQTKIDNYTGGTPSAGSSTDLSTRFSYDEYGHVTKSVADQGLTNSSTESSYDLLGNVISTTTHAAAGDAGRTTTNIFDPAGRPAGIQDAISPTAAPSPACPVSWLDVWEQMGAFGKPVILNITTAGQKGSVTFTGTAGQRVSILVSGNSYTPVTVLNPDGTTLANGSIAYWWGNWFTNVLTLPQAGTYTIGVNPGGATGTYTVTAWSLPPDVAVTSLANGSPVDMNITTPGQNGTVTFTGSVGQRVSVDVAGNPGTPVTITNPDGSTLAGGYIANWWGNWFTNVLTLAQAGTYTIHVSPGGDYVPNGTAMSGPDTGIYTTTVWTLPPDVTLTTSANGSPLDVNITTPGQNGYVTFSGTTGQRVSVEVAAGGFTGQAFTPISITNPDGTTLAGDSTSYWWGNWFTEVIVLPQTGTYTIDVLPGGPYVSPGGALTMYSDIGIFTVTVWTVPPDVALTTTVGGGAAVVNITTPGQSGSVTFPGSSGQTVDVDISGLYPTPVSITNPDGTTLASGNIAYWLNYWDSGAVTLAQTGTYTINISTGGSYVYPGTAITNYGDTGQFTILVTAPTSGLVTPTIAGGGRGNQSVEAGAIATLSASTAASVADLAYAGAHSAPSRAPSAPVAARVGAGSAARSTASTSRAGARLFADALPQTQVQPQSLGDTTTCYCNSVSHFNMAGQTISSVDALGVQTAIWYDLNGRPVKSIGNFVAGGASGPDQNVASTFQYDSLGRAVSTTDAIGRVTSVSYDGSDHVVKVTRPDLSWTRTNYTPAGRALETSATGAPAQSDNDVAWTRTVYDAAGRKVQTLANYDRSGNAQYQYQGFETGSNTCSSAADGAFVLNAAVAATSADSVLAASGLNRLRVTANGGASSGVACAMAGGFVPGQTYNARLSVWAPSGATVNLLFGQDVSSSGNHASGQVVGSGSWQTVNLSWTQGSGSSISASIAAVTSAPAGTQFYLDDISVWNAATPARNIPATTVLNADGEVVASLTPPGHAGDPQPLTVSTYDAMAELTSVTTSVQASRPANASDSNLKTTYTYDLLGRRTDTTDPKGIISHLAYNRLNQVVASTANYVSGGASNSIQNLRSTFAFDNLGEVLGSCSPAAVDAGCDPTNGADASSWHYAYNAMGHVTSQTPPSANPSDSTLAAVGSTGFVYNVAGQLVSTCTYVSGGCANALRHTDATYDNLGRQTQTRVYSGPGTNTLKMTSSTTYDAASEKVSSSFDGTGSGEGSGTVNYGYDAAGHQNSVSGSTATTTSVYNADGTVASRVDASGSSTFTYNALGQLLTSSGAAYGGTVTYSWRLDGLMDTRGWPGGQTASFSYDGANRPIGETIGAIVAVGEAYDRDGNVTSESQSLAGITGAAGAGNQSYQYDNLSRVITDTMTNPSGTQLWQKAYTYDADSNRTSVNDSGTTTSYEYNALDQIVSSTESGVRTTFGYDAFGNMTSTFVAPARGITPTPQPVSTYYAENSSIMTRSGSSQYWGTTWTGAHDGSADFYTDGSVAFTLSGSGPITLHQFGGGTATLTIDGQVAGTLTGGCASDNPQTFTVSGSGSHTFVVNNIVSQSSCALAWGWGFDGVDWTNTTSFTAADAAPTNLVAAAASSTSVSLSWTAPLDNPNLIRYSITRNGTPLTTVAAGTTAITDQTAQPGVTYQYGISAVDAYGNTSSAATSGQVTTPTFVPPADTTAPTVPVGLVATKNGSSEIDLSWATSSDNVAIAGYQIYRDGVLLTTVASTTWFDTGLAAGSNHAYTVAAIDAAGNASAQSSSASATTTPPDTSAPTAPTGVKAVVATPYGLAVSWTASTDNVGVTSYTIVRNGSPISNVTGAVTSFTDVTTSPATAYTYTVTASDAAGNVSATSAPATATAPAYQPPADSTAPSTPTGLSAVTKNSTEIDLAWAASTDNVSVAGYQVYRNGVLVATTASAAFADTPITAGSSNTYYVVAIDGASNLSGHSLTASASTPGPDTTAPSVPTSVSATSSAWNSATVTWTASTDSVGVTSYAISRNGTAIAKVSGSSHTYTDVSTQPGTNYSYTVAASDAAGNASAASSAGSVTTAAYLPSADTTAPSAPTGLTATALNANEIDLSWTASTDNVAVAGYKVYRNSTLVATTASTTYADAPIAAGSANTYYLVAIDGAGNASGQSGSASATTASDTTAPTVPSGVTATSSTWNSATVSWTASTDAVGVTSYTILRNGTAIGKVSAAATSYLDATTQPSTAYTYTVSAVDASGNASAASSGAAVTTGACSSCTTTTTLNPVADAYVNQASSATNYGTATTLLIKGTSGSIENSYLRFDTTNLPAGTITGATLKLYSTGASSTGYTVKAESNTTWVESSITYANAPAAGSTITSVASTTANAFSSATVTSAVTTRAPISFVVTDPSTTTAITFDSNQFATSADRPQLVVTTYAAPADTTAPTAPSNLVGTVKSGSEVDLSWTGSTDATAVAGYRLYRDGTLIATVGSTSWYDTGLAAGSTHTYTVSAIDAAGNASAQTAALSKTTLGVATPDGVAPTTPTGVTAVASGANKVTVAWTASTDNVALSSYVVSRNGSVLSKVAAGSTSFVDLRTAASTAYTYTVSAVDASGNASAASSGAAVTTPASAPPTDTTAPAAPTGLTATAKSATEIDLSWTASTDNVAVAGYRIYRNGTLVATTASTTYADTPISAGSSNTYYAVAIDGSGNASSQSATASASTTGPDTSAPTAPTAVHATATAWNATTLTWTASTDNVGVTSYTISRNGSVLIRVSGSATSFTDVSTQPGSTNTYTVTATDAAGNTSAASGSASATTPAYVPPADTTAPSTPAGVVATARSSGEIDLAWTSSTDNVAVAGYRVYRDGAVIATVGSNSWFDTGLTAGSAHTYTVIAFDAAGNASAISGSASATTTPPDAVAPSTPSSVAVTSSAPNIATVTWTASTDNVGVTSYTVLRNGTAVGQVSGSTTAFIDATTAQATTYAYTVTASDAAGNASAASSPASVTTGSYTPPADTVAPTSPTALTATAAPAEIDLSWTAATDNNSVAGYTISRDGTTIATSYSTSYVDIGVTTGIAHNYTVTAFDGAGNNSTPSAPATATAQPALPTSVTYTYDLLDRLTAITTASGQATTFTIDALGRHASQSVTGQPTQTYSYLATTDTIVAISSTAGTTTSAIDAIGDRVSTMTPTSFGYALSDLHGNMLGALNATGAAITDAFAYDAYGNVVASVTSSLPTPWRYQGRVLESAAGTPDLYDFNARSYNPTLGTFTSLDSVAGSVQNPLTLNRYLYANANPETMVDPTGHWGIDLGGIVNTVVHTGQNVVGAVVQTGQNVVAAAQTTVGQAWHNITTTATQAWNNITTTASQAWNNIYNTATQTINNIKNTATQTVNNIKNTVTQVVTTAVTATTRVVQTVYHAATQVVQTVVHTAVQVVQTAATVAGDVVSYGLNHPLLVLGAVGLIGACLFPATTVLCGGIIGGALLGGGASAGFYGLGCLANGSSENCNLEGFVTQTLTGAEAGGITGGIFDGAGLFGEMNASDLASALPKWAFDPAVTWGSKAIQFGGGAAGGAFTDLSTALYDPKHFNAASAVANIGLGGLFSGLMDVPGADSLGRSLSSVGHNLWPDSPKDKVLTGISVLLGGITGALP